MRDAYFDRGLCREAKSIYYVCNFYFQTNKTQTKSPGPWGFTAALLTYVVGVHVNYVSYVDDAWAALSLTALANKQKPETPC